MKVNPCQQCRKSWWEFSECCSKYILLVMHHQSWNVAEARVSIWNWSTWWHRQETASGARIRVRIGSKRGWKKKGNQKERRGVKIWNKERKKNLKAWMGPDRKELRLWPVASRGFQFMGRKVSSALSLLLIPTAVMLFLSKSFYTAPRGLTLGWTDICCYFLLHSVLFGDTLLISSFFDLASLCPSHPSFRCPICSSRFSPLTRAHLSIGPALAFVSLVYLEFSFLI